MSDRGVPRPDTTSWTRYCECGTRLSMSNPGSRCAACERNSRVSRERPSDLQGIGVADENKERSVPAPQTSTVPHAQEGRAVAEGHDPEREGTTRSPRALTGKDLSFSEARKRAGYTQEQLAEKLKVELSTVGRWERGTQSPQGGVIE